jgi:hypothetical protein
MLIAIWYKALQRFESLRAIIGHSKSRQMPFQVVMGFVVIPFHGGRFARTVHPFHLAIGPGMVGFGQPMVKPMFMTDAIKDMVNGIDIALPMGERDAVIGEHRVDLLGSGSAHVPEDLRGDHVVGFWRPFGLGKLAGAVHSDTQVELTFFRADRCAVEMTVADRIGLKLLLPRLLAGHVR